MGWIQIVLYIVTQLPNFVASIQKLIEQLHQKPKAEQAWLKSQMADAVLIHKETGCDKSIRDICVGVGCPVK